MVPDGWERKRLGDLVDFLDGQRRPIREIDRRLMAGPFPYYGASGIIDYVNGYLFDDDLILLGEDGANIINRSTPLAFRVSGKIWVNNHAHVLKPKDGIDIGFLAEYLEHLPYDELNTGTAQPKLTRVTCEELSVLLPSRAEQTYIGSLAAVWDRAIEQTARLIEAKGRLKAGLMQQLLIGRRRFQEFIRTAATRATRFGAVPADWDYPRVGDVASEVTERNADGGATQVLSCTKYDGLVDSLKYFGKRVFSADTSGYKLVRRGQFAYATNHVEEGSIGLLEFADAGLVSPMYTVFETTSRVHPPFLYKVFKTELYRHIFQANTSASVNRRGGLRWDDFARIRVPLPSVDEQERISDCIDTCEAEAQLLQQQLDALRTQKRALMQKLLTGQIRVKAQGGSSCLTRR